MEDNGGPSLCFHNLNSSCRRLQRPHSEAALLYTLLASISLLTVTLNLLVIIAIAHFRELHSPTNSLLQSLAVADLVVGLLAMPVEGLRSIEMCWLLGRLMCALTPYLSYCLLSASVGSMVLISIDRYLAICDPLLYSTKVTLTHGNISICLCWACSFLYNGLILMEHLAWPDRYNSCQGECMVVISHVSGIIDLLVTFLGPCTVMVVLYIRVFVVVVSQVRSIKSQTAAVSNNRARPRVELSERKAAKTLGIVMVVFLMCFCPYYYPSFIGEEISNNLSYFAFLSWIMMINSSVNPLIYALFYPWFRKSLRLIFTLKILQPGSREMKVM